MEKCKRAMEQNDPITFPSTVMETSVKGQEGQKPKMTKASGGKNPSDPSRIGVAGSSSKMTTSEPIIKDRSGE